MWGVGVGVGVGGGVGVGVGVGRSRADNNSVPRKFLILEKPNLT